MQKYVALFCTPAATMEAWMKGTSAEERDSQMKKMMDDWKIWMEAHKASIVDEGLPLGKTMRTRLSGTEASRNDLNYMMIVQAESPEEAASLFSDNPHLRDIPDSYVDVMGTMGPSGA